MRMVTIDNDFELTGPIERGDWETVEAPRRAGDALEPAPVGRVVEQQIGAPVGVDVGDAGPREAVEVVATAFDLDLEVAGAAADAAGAKARQHAMTNDESRTGRMAAAC